VWVVYIGLQDMHICFLACEEFLDKSGSSIRVAKR
jgi:hypothetical protein